MKRLILLFLFITGSFYAQELEPPQISVDSGFYEEGFEVSLSHEDSELIILYTLDGSEPTIENLDGKVWNYKTQYPLYPGEEFGELLHDTLWTYTYEIPLEITDRTPEETILKDIQLGIEYDNVGPVGPLYKSTILRARSYSESTGAYSEIVGRNYFISEEGNNRYSIPVVAVSMDNDRFYGYEEGIGVPGILFDEYREENPDAEFDGWAPANYRLKGSDTEMQIHFNYFENGSEILNHNAGLRLNGGYTRSFPNKSLRLYAKSDYGSKNFSHPFFTDYEVSKFKRMILRNSGNDANSSFFRDAFMHQMAKNLSFEIQESQPVAVFINGEYNGLRNLRERYDKKYFDKILNIPADSLDFLENHLEIKEGDDEFYNEMMDYFENNSLQSNGNLDQALTYLDPVNFTDYYATYIFVANDDWPGNNYLFWRYKSPYNPTAEEEHKDGRFRWLLKDLDRGFFLHQRSENGYEANTLEWATLEEGSGTLLMRRLLKNEAYKQYFITRFADLLNTTFLENRVVSIIEEFETIYAPEIEENSRRWNNFTASEETWANDVQRIKDFAQNRPTFQREHLIEKFNLGGIYDLVLNVSDQNEGYIHLNTIAIAPTTDGINEDSYPWVGEYFKNIPVSLKAIAKEGYVFSHWSGAIDSTDPEITLTLGEDTYIKANFIDENMGLPEEVVSNLSVYPNPTDGILNLKSNTDWDSYSLYNMQGSQVKSGKLEGKSIDISNLSQGIYFLRVESNEGEIIQKKIIKK